MYVMTPEPAEPANPAIRPRILLTHEIVTCQFKRLIFIRYVHVSNSISVTTDSSDQVNSSGNAIDMHSRGDGFVTWPGHLLSWQSFLLYCSVPSDKYQYNTLNHATITSCHHSLSLNHHISGRYIGVAG
jgi:hypothetical protein